jgi:hypothetical protein
MATQKYNKSEIMKEAIYGRTFGSCLKQAWGSAKAMVQLAERSHAVRLTHVGMASLYANRVYSGD